MEIEQLRTVAKEIDCLIEEDFLQLVGITPNTARAWRNRGRAPQPILLGTRYFYPLQAIRAVIAERAKSHLGTNEVVL